MVNLKLKTRDIIIDRRFPRLRCCLTGRGTINYLLKWYNKPNSNKKGNILRYLKLYKCVHGKGLKLEAQKQFELSILAKYDKVLNFYESISVK